MTRPARPWVRQPGSRRRCSNKSPHTFPAPRLTKREPAQALKQHASRPHGGETRGWRAGTRHSRRSTDRARTRGQALCGPSPTQRPDHAGPRDRPGIRCWGRGEGLGWLPANGRRAARAVDVHASTHTHAEVTPKVKRLVPVGLCPSPAGCLGPSFPLPQNKADVGLWGAPRSEPP